MNASLFAGVNAIVCCIRHSERAVKLRDIIMSFGGHAVIHKPVAAIFAGKATAEINQFITHIISESVLDEISFCKKLNTPSIPSNVKVVSDKWVQGCIVKHELQPEEMYPALIVDNSGSEDILSPKVVESIAAATATMEARQKRFLCDESGAQCLDEPSSSKRMKTPIPAVTPGVWQELKLESEQACTQALYNLAGAKQPFTEMVAFDLDGTLIVTKSGAKFAQDKSDWKFFSPAVPQKLQELSAAGKCLAIISNQNGVGKHSSLDDIRSKLDDILSNIQCPIDVFCALEKDIYRKPRVGSFDFLNNMRVEDPAGLRFTYVGDAAGRPQSGTRKKDFAGTDLAFALNCNAEFQTPEQFFMGSKEPLHCTLHIENAGFSWRKYAAEQTKLVSASGRKRQAAALGPPSEPELIVLVGPPSSGKTTRSKNEFSYAEHINQDTLKTVAKCLSAARAALSSGKSVVVDSTNVDRKSRQQWIQLGRELQIKVRCVVCIPAKAACMHMAKFRLLDHNTPPNDRRKIEDVVIHTYFKYYVSPTLDEGFAEVDTREFLPTTPSDPESAKLLNSYL